MLIWWCCIFTCVYYYYYYYYYYYFVSRMSVLSSSLFVLGPVYHCSRVVLLHCAVSWINKQTTNNVNPWNIQCLYSRTKRYQSFLNYAVAHFQNSKWVCFILLFMFWTVYCIMCILYRMFLLYNTYLYCSFHVVYVLPIQFLGCHN